MAADRFDSPFRGLATGARVANVRRMRHLRSVRARVGRFAFARDDRGFTLIELLVTMAILVTVVGTLTGSLVSASNTENDLNNRFQTQAQARLALSKLTREIHCANQILATSTGQPLTSTAVGSVILTLPAGCPTGGATAVTAYWCTVARGSSYDLYRTTSSPCGSSGGVRWATSLVSSTPFSLPSVATNGNHYPLVHVNLLVNTRSNGALGTYNLANDIAALNAQQRTVTG